MTIKDEETLEKPPSPKAASLDSDLDALHKLNTELDIVQKQIR